MAGERSVRSEHGRSAFYCFAILTTPLGKLLAFVGQCKHTLTGDNALNDAMLPEKDNKLGVNATSSQVAEEAQRQRRRLGFARRRQRHTQGRNCTLARRWPWCSRCASSLLHWPRAHSWRLLRIPEVRVNTARMQELRMWDGIGEAISKAVVQQRQERAFKDWEDLRSRRAWLPQASGAACALLNGAVTVWSAGEPPQAISDSGRAVRQPGLLSPLPTPNRRSCSPV